MSLGGNIKKIREEKNLTQQQLTGSIFMAITIFLRVRLEMRVPTWCTIICLCVVTAAFILNFVVSRKLEKM